MGAWQRGTGAAVSHERLDRWLNQWLPARCRCAAWPIVRTAALARSFDTIVCTTQWAADEFRRVAASNLVIVPLGRRPRSVPGLVSTPPAHGDTDGALLIMASRLSREKQPEIAVEAVRELVRRRINARLIVAGDGPLRRQLEAASQGLPISLARVRFFADELAELYRAADFALAPGPVETFGLAALEAMACGTPAVVNWRSALPEIIGTSAGRVSAGSGFSFADAVQELLAQPAEPLRQAARAARGRVLVGRHRERDACRAPLASRTGAGGMTAVSVLGDSLTCGRGVGVRVPARQTWPALLAQWTPGD